MGNINEADIDRKIAGGKSMNMRIKMLIIACGAAFIAVFFCFLDVPVWRFTIVMAAATTAYHLAVRLAVGFFVFKSIKIKNCENGWFRQKKWERTLYRLIKVHSWKDDFPSYAPEKFDPKNGIDDAINATCQAEIAHFVLIFLSFVPLLISFSIGCTVFDIIVFAATGLIASAVDLLFLIVQRYNRPRLISVRGTHLKMA